MHPVLEDYLMRKRSDGNAWRLEKMDRRDRRDSKEYADERMSDYMRSVPDRREREREEDYASSDRRRDYHRPAMRLSKSDISRWKNMFENFDGTRGAHYDYQQILHAADKLNIDFDEYSEKEFCVAVNMMYADYGHIAKEYCSPDKELMFCAEMAKAFFDDPDGPEPSEKLALYFYCIVDGGL